MGEVVRVLVNTIGGTVFLMGIITNLNNWIAIALGAAGFGYAIFRALKERENWLDKRIERKMKEREYFYNRTIEESERDEHPPIKK